MLAFLRLPLRSAAREIAADPTLRVYGAPLALAHTLCFAHWTLQWEIERARTWWHDDWIQLDGEVVAAAPSDG